MEAYKLARRGDPATSKAAAEQIVPHLSRLQQLIADWAKDVGKSGFTDDDMAHYFGSSSSTYRTRRKELVDAGVLVKTSRTRIIQSTGREATVWCHKDWYPPVL